MASQTCECELDEVRNHHTDVCLLSQRATKKMNADVLGKHHCNRTHPWEWHPRQIRTSHRAQQETASAVGLLLLVNTAALRSASSTL